MMFPTSLRKFFCFPLPTVYKWKPHKTTQNHTNFHPSVTERCQKPQLRSVSKPIKEVSFPFPYMKPGSLLKGKLTNYHSMTPNTL